MESLSNYIGAKVFKESGKPFKSKLKINTVRSVTIHPTTGGLALSFVEDDSIVEMQKVKLVKE